VIYYISDLHLGHRNVIEMDHRPFETIEEMDEAIIARWNERVTEEDDVYIVGDFAYRNGYTADWYLRRLRGRKHLVCGNHDYLTQQNEKAMDLLASVEKMHYIQDAGRGVLLCHYPVAEWYGKRYGGYHVHGHIHNRRDDVYEFMSRYDRALNAGCMLTDYRPATLDELIACNRAFRQREGE
jgi:calcineurin-like phosphoesterase family protein